jgi:hypothetical protein
MMSPMDFVQKLSNVACVIQCSGIWIGGKGWGLTWKMIQCVVKPREVVSVYGKCHIQLSSEDVDQMNKTSVPASAPADEDDDDAVDASTSGHAVTSTEVEDSDAEEHLPAPAPRQNPAPTSVPTSAPTTPPAAAASEPAKKKVIKRKAP